MRSIRNCCSGLLAVALQSALVVCLLISVPLVAHAQSVSLTPQQEAMLNQLPPDQRRQAMDAIRRLQQGSTATSSASSSIGETEDLLPVEGRQDSTEALSSEPLRAQPESRIVVQFVRKEDLTPEQNFVIDDDPEVGQFEGSHLFILDENGVLSLNGISLVPLLGLGEEDIARRLTTEQVLTFYDIEARILELEPTGNEALEQFGYSLFESEWRSFDAPASGPVPTNYQLGPGDTIRVQLFGNVNSLSDIEVSRDGLLAVPEIGPISVTGLTFNELREELQSRVTEMLIGTRISTTMGRLRSIRVFVLGDAKQPGSYIVSSLSTISSALYRSGGISNIGSLRNIELKRNGEVVAVLDLYDLLLGGDTSDDERLQSGDVIFVPPIGATVGVDGAVNRPAIYELKDRATVADAVSLAGGLRADAFLDEVVVENIDDQQRLRVISVNLNEPAEAGRPLGAGDFVTVAAILPDYEDTVVLNGHVHRPGPRQWTADMRLTNLITSADVVKPGVDWHYVLVRRENRQDRSISVRSADLAAALANPNGEQNIALSARDQVHVFAMADGRQRVIEPLLEELQLQSTFGLPYPEVRVSGRVKAPGEYPLEPGMRISDLVRAGGSLDESAFVNNAELTRQIPGNGNSQARETININLAAALRGDGSANLELQPYDHLNIAPVPQWGSNWAVRVDGEVQFPGEYQIRRGETLADLISRVGGLTEHAFPEGAIFLRESLKEREQEQIETLTRRMESDLAALALESRDSGGSEALATGETLLEQLRTTQPVGRLVIDLNQVVDSNGPNIAQSIELRDGDEILVPTRSQEVTVIGEVQHTTSHLFQAGLSREDYIELSGGMTRRADGKLTYVVRASGAVISGGRSRWFGRSDRVEIRPGDTIVVPLDTDRIRPITFWTNVTQIVYQAAIAVAAVATFDN